MFLIVAYDVESKRNPKILKLLRKYLFHVQNSVFEGDITPAKYNELKTQLNKIIDEDNDRIIVYKMMSNKNLDKEYLGKQHDNELIL